MNRGESFRRVNNIYHSQNVLSNRNEALTVWCSHSAETVEFRYGFKLLWLAIRFQTLTVSVTISHFFMSVFCELTQPLTVAISFHFQTLPASCERGLSIVSNYLHNYQPARIRTTVCTCTNAQRVYLI